VETTVQVLQALERGGTYDSSPKVDAYLKGIESRSSPLPDGLRVCAARLARAMYALRSKRNIVHKGDVDTSAYDLRLLYAGSQWILAELLALASGITGAQAGALIAEVELPVGELVEAVDDRRIVHADMRVREEALVVLMSFHPAPVASSGVIKSMDRRAAQSVRNTLTQLWRDKLVHRNSDGHLILTAAGLREALATAQRHAAA
jgi:hypothetical protein